ncbi:MAG: hypothetical protein AABZ44_05730 [Elusimicrobiota bacterium]
MRKIKDPDQQPATKADIRALADRIGSSDTKVDSLGTRVGNLETKVDSLGTRVGNLETKVDSLGDAVKNQALMLLEQKNEIAEVKTMIKSSESRIITTIDTFMKEFIETSRLQLMQGQHLADHDGDIKDLKIRVKRLETATTR